MINLHSTQTKKSYRKPVLVKKGTVSKLTRGGTGGSTDFDLTAKA
ncbi:lasso RiPP family leader peptide-containing protein [Dyadobacter sp. LHD-138]|nr:lasso RiPP family leader peptide-containing protein [Dyadobacter sp. LHD-138]MDQ6478908.1 lasso RiPP family leader peptide-containing protein [Dyadobacter sp. LHD-138]